MKEECCINCGTKKFNYGVKNYRPIIHCENLECECHNNEQIYIGDGEYMSLEDLQRFLKEVGYKIVKI